MKDIGPLFPGGLGGGLLGRQQSRRGRAGERRRMGRGRGGPGKHRIRMHGPRGNRHHHSGQSNRRSSRQQANPQRGFQAHVA